MAEFIDPERIRRLYHFLAEKGAEVPPEELAAQIKLFFTKVQDELAVEGVWWTALELIAYCEQPIVMTALRAHADFRKEKEVSWQVYVDVITSLERGKFKP